jgi:hypothetical protein
MFPFNQEPKTKDCGYRCLYYALESDLPYEEWIDQFKVFDPAHHGIFFSDIAQVLKFNERDFKFTQLTEKGLYIIFSGCWLKHGHYFVYQDGVVFCSTKSGPYRMPLKDVIEQLETKSSDHGFKVMKVFPKGEKHELKLKPWEQS